ncbi:MAG: ribose 5-phosphate isomerase B [Coriobacteriales bacterium]|jgi:ribose 5-phosphate isomerase B|nr:ribose 5-phosphate isomerase B [Coriobacteriales bacterium]
MKIAIGADHGGFEQKHRLVPWLGGLGHEVRDFGCDSTESCDYPDFAEPVARAVAQGKADYGILVCGTGIGMAISANKVAGVRAANVTSPQFARLAREHNNANLLTLSGRFVSLEDNQAIISDFLKTDFAGGRHQRRVDKIMALESTD